MFEMLDLCLSIVAAVLLDDTISTVELSLACIIPKSYASNKAENLPRKLRKITDTRFRKPDKA